MKRFIIAIIIVTSFYFVSTASDNSVHSEKRIIKATLVPEEGGVGTVFKYTVAVAGDDLQELEIKLPPNKIIYSEVTDGKEKSGDSIKKSDEPESGASVPLFIIHRASKDEAQEGATGQISVTLELSCYRPGIHTLPEINIKENDGISLGYKVPEVKIISANADGKLEDIEAPLDLSGNYIRLILLIFGAIVFAFALFFLYRFVKNRRYIAPEPELTIPPIEKFLKAVNDFDLSGKIERGEINEYVFSISILFRRYLSSYYGFDAAEMTTDEISRRLKKYMQREGLSDFTGDILKSMHLWDLSKFAEFSPSSELLQDNLTATVTIAKKISSYCEDSNGKV